MVVPRHWWNAGWCAGRQGRRRAECRYLDFLPVALALFAGALLVTDLPVTLLTGGGPSV
jgi:hypothetical protein